MMDSLWRMKSGIATMLALGFVSLWVLGLVIGISYATGYTSSSGATGPGVGYSIIGLCSATALIPGIVFLYIAVQSKKREREIIEIAVLVKSYRRVKLDKIAKKLGKTEFETEKILADCVDKGQVDGFFDRTTEEFVVRSAVAEELAIYRCRSCGATASRKFLAGETAKCDFCGGVMEPARQEAIITGAGVAQVYTCFRCGSPLRFIPEYQRWFCDRCQNYV